jgi:hypothetical protein
VVESKVVGCEVRSESPQRGRMAPATVLDATSASRFTTITRIHPWNSTPR